MSQSVRRVLALELRPRSLGFVVFEGPEQLLDWGVKSLCNFPGHEVPACERVSPLLGEFQPAVVLLKSSVWERKMTSVQSPVRPRCRIRPTCAG